MSWRFAPQPFSNSPLEYADVSVKAGLKGGIKFGPSIMIDVSCHEAHQLLNTTRPNAAMPPCQQKCHKCHLASDYFSDITLHQEQHEFFPPSGGKCGDYAVDKPLVMIISFIVISFIITVINFIIIMILKLDYLEESSS